MKDRIYVCHTYYHVYITLLKEFAMDKEKQKKATIVLSKMSNDFDKLEERLVKEKIFEEVLVYDEKKETFFPELTQLKENQNSLIKNMFARIRFTKELGKAQEEYVPTDFKQYKEVYVFCDSDPIGYYLNYKHIKYHAIEDGLNSIANIDAARYDNLEHFKLKVAMSRLGLIFIQNGYGKYCIDMEVNDKSSLLYPMKKNIEVSRSSLMKRVTEEEKESMIRIFIENINALKKEINKQQHGIETVLILTEPLCALDVRETIFKDLVEEYSKNASVTIKPHPRDLLDYEVLFPELPIIDKKIPMEILNFIDGLYFTKVISVLTEVKAIAYASEAVKLGPDFMDKYEAPEIHRQNEKIIGAK